MRYYEKAFQRYDPYEIIQKTKQSGRKQKLKPGVLPDPVLVGREKEIEELETFLNSALEGKGKTVLISGEAGSGKTRLSREFLKKAQQKGANVIAGWCLSDAATPYFPFVEAFHSYFSSENDEEQETTFQQPSSLGPVQMIGGERGVTAWLAGLTPLQKTGALETSSPQVWKDQVFAGVAGTLHSIAARQPIVLFIEDIHWADSASLALLHYLARAFNDSDRILVLATLRSEELTADTDGRPHLLSQTMQLMRREDLFTEIKLTNLDQTGVAKVAQSMIGGNIQEELAENLMTESKGNPLFIVESLRMLAERKNLVEEDNQWRLTIDAFGIPPKIKDIIMRRLAVLKYTQRRVLDAASVIGEKFDLELLSSVLGMDTLEVLETLNMIAYSTSLVSVEGNYYRFDHARSREVLYDELSAPLKRGYHQRIAEKIESKSEKPPYSDLAFHYAQAGNAEKAEKYAMAAGQDALAKFSNREAAAHFTFVLQATPKNIETKLSALEGLGDAYYADCMFQNAAKTFDELAELATGKLKVRAYRKELEVTWYRDQNAAGTQEIAKKVEKLGELDPLESARIRWQSSRALFWTSPEACLKEHEALLKIFQEEYSLPDVAQLMWGTGITFVTAHKGDPKKALAQILVGIAMHHELEDARSELFALGSAAGICGVVGLLPEARSFGLKGREIAERIGDSDRAARLFVNINRSDGNQDEGEIDFSVTSKALEYLKRTDSAFTKCEIYAFLARYYAMRNDLKKAQEFFDKVLETPPQIVSIPEVSDKVLGARIALFIAKKQWTQAYEAIEELRQMIKKEWASDTIEAAVEYIYFVTLKKQGKTEEAKLHQQKMYEMARKVQERYGSTDIYVWLMARKEVEAGKEFEVRLDLANVARAPGSLIEINNIIPAGLEALTLPSSSVLQQGDLKFKEKNIGPIEVNTIKLKLKSKKPGNYTLSPSINYTNNLGETKTFNPEPTIINVRKAQPTFEVLPDRVSTGFEQLDRLLLGGIPEKHAAILSSPAIDERTQIITKFLEEGAGNDQVTFSLAADIGTSKSLIEDHNPHFYLLICNPQADEITPTQPNIFKLKGIENLTEIDIALTRIFRLIPASMTGSRRIGIEITSDVLLQHHVVNTRRWLSALLPTLKSKGFTILAMIDSGIHPPEEIQAIKSLFEGEIEISEKDQAKTLRVKRLGNQRYLQEELPLS